MSLWTDPIVIPPFQLFLTGLIFLINKAIDKKAGKHMTDLERLNYVGDKIVDTSVMHKKKVRGAVKAIMTDDQELPSETIPGINGDVDTDDDVIATVGTVLSGMQLEIDHLKHKMLESGIDVNNGETKELDHVV